MRHDPDRHHRRSVRLPGYDYAAAGTYFVTLCAAERKALFGQVVRGDVELNEYGEIVLQEWHRSLEIRPGIGLDAVVVMPNHLHGIATFGASVGASVDVGETAVGVVGDVRAHRCAPLQRRPRSLGSFVAGFKAATTKRINEGRGLPGTPVWQRNYHEHVIRSDDAYARIYNYILTNPLRWMLDRENPEHWTVDEFDQWLSRSAVRTDQPPL